MTAAMQTLRLADHLPAPIEQRVPSYLTAPAVSAACLPMQQLPWAAAALAPGLASVPSLPGPAMALVPESRSALWPRSSAAPSKDQTPICFPLATNGHVRAPATQAPPAMPPVPQQPAPWPTTASTAMMRNIPNRYTAEELLADILEKGFAMGSFDFFYLPMDFQTKRNRGFAFINFKDTAEAKRFAESFHGISLERYRTHKVIAVAPAAVQGFEANVQQYARKDSQRVQNPWFKPMIFNED